MPSEQPRDGLYGKYEVYEDGEPVNSCFVLEPESDKDAREALRTYADSTENDELAADLREWMDQLEDANGN